eukprot:scaffold276161_cov38-Tisochrysis_lutea.AAC.1
MPTARTRTRAASERCSVRRRKDQIGTHPLSAMGAPRCPGGGERGGQPRGEERTTEPPNKGLN